MSLPDGGAENQTQTKDAGPYGFPHHGMQAQNGRLVHIAVTRLVPGCTRWAKAA